MKTEVAILGVCCQCQRTHPVTSNPEPNKELVEIGMAGEGEEEYYLMARHRMFGETGSWCEGEGTIPASIIVD